MIEIQEDITALREELRDLKALLMENGNVHELAKQDSLSNGA